MYRWTRRLVHFAQLATLIFVSLIAGAAHECRGRACRSRRRLLVRRGYRCNPGGTALASPTTAPSRAPHGPTAGTGRADVRWRQRLRPDQRRKLARPVDRNDTRGVGSAYDLRLDVANGRHEGDDRQPHLRALLEFRLGAARRDLDDRQPVHPEHHARPRSVVAIHVAAPRDHLRRRVAAALRQRRAGLVDAGSRRDGQLIRSSQDRRQRDLAGVVLRTDRRPSGVQPRALGRRAADGHEHRRHRRADAARARSTRRLQLRRPPFG